MNRAMRIAVLTTRDSWYWRDLCRAAEGRYRLARNQLARNQLARYQLDCLAFQDLQASVGDVRAARVGTAQQDLGSYDAVLVRTMPLGSLEQVVFRMNALAQMEKLATCVINPARSLEIAIDKYLTLARLADVGMRVPATVTCQSWQQSMEAFALLGGDVVVKPIFGGEGRGITRIDDPALALRAFKMLDQLGAVIYLQQFVPHQGCDFRLLVVGSQVLGMRRCNATDWRTNVSRGAVTQPLEVTDSLRDLALTAARTVGCPLAGVDLLPGLDGQLYVLEVNAVPGWKALASTTRVDVARLVLELVEQQVATRA